MREMRQLLAVLRDEGTEAELAPVPGLDRLAELNEKELTLEKFQAKGLLKRRNELLKILGNGELSTAITVHAHKFSKAAQEKIEKAGGKAILVA